MQDINCCAAEGWPELGRERLDMTEKPVLIRCTHKTNTQICVTWTEWDWKQHYIDILERAY